MQVDEPTSDLLHALRLLSDEVGIPFSNGDAGTVTEAIAKIESLLLKLNEREKQLAAYKAHCAALEEKSAYLTEERDMLQGQCDRISLENAGSLSRLEQSESQRRLTERLLDQRNAALERIIEAWDGDSESMHDDPAEIAKSALCHHNARTNGEAFLAGGSNPNPLASLQDAGKNK